MARHLLSVYVYKGFGERCILQLDSQAKPEHTARFNWLRVSFGLHGRGAPNSLHVPTRGKNEKREIEEKEKIK